jgi:hypothetical protein
MSHGIDLTVVSFKMLRINIMISIWLLFGYLPVRVRVVFCSILSSVCK